MTREIWKKTHIKRYSVSNLGRCRDDHSRRILKEYPSSKEYLYCSLKEGIEHKWQMFSISRLVAFAFLQKPQIDQTQVNHKNGIKTDNSLENLEWTSNAENQQHAYDTGLNVMSEKRKEKISKKNIGKKHTEEAKKKMGLSNKGKKLSPEHREKISIANKGKKRSEEFKKKMSDLSIGREFSNVTREKISAANKGKKHTDETKKKISTANKGREFSDEHKKNLSVMAKRREEKKRLKMED